MRQAIETRFLGATNTLGERILARAQAGRKIVAWDYSLDAYANHRAAAEAFAREWGWTGSWVGGASADGRGYVFVQTDGRPDSGFEVAS